MKVKKILSKFLDWLFPYTEPENPEDYRLLISTYQPCKNVTDEDIEKLTKLIESYGNSKDE